MIHIACSKSTTVDHTGKICRLDPCWLVRKIKSNQIEPGNIGTLYSGEEKDREKRLCPQTTTQNWLRRYTMSNSPSLRSVRNPTNVLSESPSWDIFTILELMVTEYMLPSKSGISWTGCTWVMSLHSSLDTVNAREPVNRANKIINLSRIPFLSKIPAPALMASAIFK